MGEMKFRECFTLDLRARGDNRLKFHELASRLILDPGYRLVVYYRISVYLLHVRFFRRVAGLLSSLIAARVAWVAGVEISRRFEIGSGLLMFDPHDSAVGEGCRIGRNVTIYNGVTLGPAP